VDSVTRVRLLKIRTEVLAVVDYLRGVPRNPSEDEVELVQKCKELSTLIEKVLTTNA